MVKDELTEREKRAEHVLRSLDAGAPAYVQPRKTRFGMVRQRSDIKTFHVEENCSGYPDMPEVTNVEDALERGLALCGSCVIKIVRDL